MTREPLSAYVRRTGCDEMGKDVIADRIAELERRAAGVVTIYQDEDGTFGAKWVEGGTWDHPSLASSLQEVVTALGLDVGSIASDAQDRKDD